MMPDDIRALCHMAGVQWAPAEAAIPTWQAWIILGDGTAIMERIQSVQYDDWIQLINNLRRSREEYEQLMGTQRAR